VEKVSIAIVGPGNIGTDLMYKILKRSKYMYIRRVIGIFPPSQSEGLRIAQQEGIDIAWNGIKGVEEIADEIDIIFEATTAKAHLQNAPAYKKMGLVAIDLTPAAVGPYIVPAVNIEEHLDKNNVNMVTCGGQATVPIVYAVNRVSRVKYAEIISSIASKSAGPGTRKNIDEFTQTTAKALEKVGGAKKGKAIIILNPAEPPIIMQNTIHCIVEDISKKEEILQSIYDMVKTIQQYVPGYALKVSPVVFEDENRVTVIIRVIGEGDYLPTYAGNLDIMTAAAAATGERFAEKILKEKGVLETEVLAKLR
jgi:acetaldehyde dehydrogenase